MRAVSRSGGVPELHGDSFPQLGTHPISDNAPPRNCLARSLIRGSGIAEERAVRFAPHAPGPVAGSC